MTGLRASTGLAIGVQPTMPTVVYADRKVVSVWEAVTITPHGDWADVVFNAAQVRLTITPGGRFETRALAAPIGSWEQLALSADGRTLSRVGIVLTVDGPVVPPVAGATLPHIDGIHLRDSGGKRVSLNLCDMFFALRWWLDGIDLTPFAAQSTQLGFDGWRVWLSASKHQNTIADIRPDEHVYEQVRPFAKWCNAHGLLLMPTVNVDMQDIFPNQSDRIRNWLRMTQELRDTESIFSGGNQFPKNGYSPSNDLPDPGDVIWSRGSNIGEGVGQPALPPGPHARFAEFHPMRDVHHALIDTIASPLALFDSGVHCPLIISEPNGWNVDGSKGRWTDPDLAFRFGRHYGAEVAGACFHNDWGQGLHGPELMPPPLETIARRWSEGMRL